MGIREQSWLWALQTKVLNTSPACRKGFWQSQMNILTCDLSSKMRRLQCYVALQTYSHLIGYYRTISIRNRANKTSKYISGMLRRILASSNEYFDVRTAHGFSSKIWKLQCYFELPTYLHSNGYYRTILIRNHANENSKYFSGMLRRILATSDWDSNLGTVLNSVNRRLQCYLTIYSEVNFKELLKNHPD
jgi:hypothetical protein